MTLNEIKTMDDAAKYYNEKFNEISKSDNTDHIKMIMLHQLNCTMTNIYNSLK